jgi:hypothetical protein
MFRSSKFFVVLLVLIFATAAFAFAATNTMPAVTSAGEGSQTISGYTVGNVDYVLNTAVNPSVITDVEFTLRDAALNPAPVTLSVQIQLQAAGPFYTCTNSGGALWNCDTAAPAITVPAAGQLRVITTD